MNKQPVMARPNLARWQYLSDVARRADEAPHGECSALYAEAAEQLGVSVATVMRDLATLRPSCRKRRNDAGQSALTLAEARAISAYMLDSSRKNGKQLASLEEAVEVLRSNGEIAAGRLDESTGEWVALSLSAIGRALYTYNLHPEQLRRPTPKTALASLHPNHVWQIDPSLCVLYYLPAAEGEAIQVMDEAKFYKNKPANIRRIEKERVWRYVITDHTSGVIFVHYVLGAESGVNLLTAFIHAACQRGNQPFYGIPRLVMVDPGSANTGAVFRNACRALGITLQVNVPGQPWAKGQVEKANDIVERSFEHRLKFLAEPPTTLEQLNSAVEGWMAWFNGTKVHGRTGQTRFGVWQSITAEQLVLAPEPAVIRAVAMAKPEPRKVNVQLEVSFRGRSYSVAQIPGVQVGMQLQVMRNPWHEDVAGIVYKDADGREVVQLVQALELNQYGFQVDAPVIGETYRSHADTQLETNRKELERLSMAAGTDAEAAAQRKRGATPFGGKLDPMKPITDTPLPEYLPKRGTELDVQAPTIQALRLTPVDAARRLRARLGEAWTGEHYRWLVQRYPEGVTEDDLPSIEAAMRRLTPFSLRAVGGE
ncbi:integrase [Gallaecimonas kandeliae]|uniref:integrase n=1 Tax=Gallaecimonas kandeliae TaxID=3029055 RepID=UPI002648EC1B|nr:integrase [Gallaecimonas kandeliae]WKE65048.1 integrase [Gallaecimonas kandeliae]